VRDILERKTVYPVIKSLLEKKIVLLQEDLQEKFKPKTVICVELAEPYASDPTKLSQAFELTSRSSKQTTALMAFIQLSKQQSFVLRQEVCELADVENPSVKAIADKGLRRDRSFAQPVATPAIALVGIRGVLKTVAAQRVQHAVLDDFDGGRKIGDVVMRIGVE